MGRAKGDPNRSKSRPSSSSLAASHLQTPGAAPLGFGGYVGSSLVESTLSSEREVSLDVDGEAAVHLKRLSKRDSTTKLKALAVLRGIFKEHSAEDLAPILMQWVFEYKRLVHDNNRQVRESAHNAMADLTTNAGMSHSVYSCRRGLAPHLRSLMGAWWVAQFDPSREVAEAAQNSFQATFQERKKRVDALVYCLKDIINYVDENLKLTPQILIELGTPSEEVAEKMERILSSSLLALAALLDVLVGSTSSLWREGPAEGISLTSTAVGAGEAVKEAATSLFHKHKSLQSSVKNKSSQVRSAGYQALRTYIQHIPQVFKDEENLEDSVKLVFGSLGDKATSCHQPMWEMILLFAKRFPQAWGCACIRKAVLPKLWDFLKHGCFGSQEFSYPCIFPLIALIPPEFMAPPQGFFLEFFSSLWRGMNASASVKDRLALLTTFQECFVWVVKNAKRLVMDKAPKELQDFLMEEVLLKMVWCCYIGVLDQESAPASVVPKDGHVTLSQETSVEVAGVVVDIMILLGQEDGPLDIFWPGFQSTGINILHETFPENDTHLARLAEFFSLLDRKTNQTDRKQIVWPVRDAVQPFVAKAFPAIKSAGSSEAIKLLGQLISSHGISAFASTEMAVTEGTEQFFQKEIVPWCLMPGNGELSSSKVDLLLAFFDIKEFQQFWSPTLEQATAWVRPGEEYRDLPEEDIKQVEVLAILVEKFSERWVEAGMFGKPRAIDAWRSPKLDAVGLTLASSDSLSHPSCLRLLRNLLGAKYPEMKLSRLLAPDAAVHILQQLLQHLLDVLSLHESSWIQTAPSYILLGQANEGLSDAPVDDSERAKRFELARATLEVVGVFSCSSVYVEYEHIGSQLLSAIFCMYWALLKVGPRKIGDGDHDESDDEMRDEDVQHVTLSSSLDGDRNTPGSESPSLDILVEQSEISLTTYLQTLHKNTSPAACQELSTVSRFQIRSILLKIVRNALLQGDYPDAALTSILCATWVCEIVEYLCMGEEEIQETITSALASSPAWSLWADAAPFKDDLIPIITLLKSTTLDQEELQKKFCAFADVLATYLGPTTVYAGCPSMAGDIPSSPSYRVWLIVELLCTWEWPGGAVPTTLMKFLCEAARNARGQQIPHLLRICVQSLFEGSSLVSSNQVQEGVEDRVLLENDPYMNALLMLLRALLWDEGAWGKAEAYQFFFQYVSKSSAEAKTSMCSLKVLPSVLPILMPIMRQPASETSEGFLQEESQSLKQDVSEWLNKALSYPPLNSCEGVPVEWETKQWVQVAIACYPLLLPGVTSGIVAASQAKVSLLEMSLLFKLMKKQSIVPPVEDKPQLLSVEPTPGIHQELTLAKLISVSVAYCWQDFGVDEWVFVLGHLRKWLDSTVMEFEEMTEIIVDFFKDSQKGTLMDLQELSGREFLIELAATSISILILVKDLNKMESVPALRTLAILRQSSWEVLEDHMMDQILRILLATGLSESAVMESNNEGDDAAKLIAKHRAAESFLWESLADIALEAAPRARAAAVRAADLWGVGNGSISALYALLFSPNSNRALQWVAFHFLSEEPLQHLAVTWGGGVSPNQTEVEDGIPQEAEKEDSLAAAAKIRPELSKVLETPAMLLQSSLTSTVRVHYFLGCSIFLMRLQALPPLSPTRERLLQFAQDSNTPSTLLDCLFQHIPLDLTSGTSASRRRATVVGAKINVAATSATRAVSSGSVSFAVNKSLQTLKEDNLVGLAGAIYGMLLRVLPACVRIWFTGLRDRATATAIENFTITNCSSHLLADEFSQLQKSVVADDTLSVRANRTLREVIALYKKEEAGIDIVIRLPSCYPLRAVDLDCTRRLGISETLLRKWILSMASFLRNQNGAILEAIHMWKKNVDREFEGVEECPICYSIIHTTNHSLPRLACKTCKHKFHSACLYKWFSTSHKSTCPLCQTPF